MKYLINYKQELEKEEYKLKIALSNVDILREKVSLDYFSNFKGKYIKYQDNPHDIFLFHIKDVENKKRGKIVFKTGLMVTISKSSILFVDDNSFTVDTYDIDSNCITIMSEEEFTKYYQRKLNGFIEEQKDINIEEIIHSLPESIKNKFNETNKINFVRNGDKSDHEYLRNLGYEVCQSNHCEFYVKGVDFFTPTGYCCGSVTLSLSTEEKQIQGVNKGFYLFCKLYKDGIIKVIE